MKDIKEFQCLRCGACCRWHGLVRITEQEADAIARYLNLDLKEFLDQYTRLCPDRTGLSLNEDADGTCILLDRNTQLCRINAVKPGQCKAFPRYWNFPGWEQECAGGKAMNR